MEFLTGMFLLTPCGVEHISVDLNRKHVFEPTPIAGVIHIWVVCHSAGDEPVPPFSWDGGTPNLTCILSWEWNQPH